MKELLEPIYLNEKMLLNCAGYLFDGVALSKEVQQKNEDRSNKNINGEANAETSGVLDYIAKASGKTNAAFSFENSIDFSSSSVKNFTLGAIHMKALEELYNKEHINELENIREFKNTLPYTKIEGNLQPVDFFEIIQIIKSLTPHFESIFDLFGNQIFKKNNVNARIQSKDKNIKELTNIKNGIQILTGVINELEKNYLESNLLEMLIFDKSGQCIGIVDLDITDQDPKRIKAQLTDGNFHIYGKITKIVSSEDEIDLIQRSLISPLFRLLEKGSNAWPDKSKAESFSSIKEIIMVKINEVLTLKVSGPAIRIRAMSICI